MLKCAICKNNCVEMFHEKVFGSLESKVYKCRNCDLFFLHPYLSEIEINKLYQNYNEIVISRVENVKKADSDEIFKIGLVEARLRYKRFKKFIDNREVLEIGSGAGCFLDTVKDNVNTLYSVEPCDSNREFIKQKIMPNIFSDLSFLINKKIKFDSIFLFHVFEHLVDPFTFIDKLNMVLKYNGCLIIEVPCVDDTLISVYNIKEFKDFYFQIQHPYYYNEASLRYIFEKKHLVINKVIYHQRYGIDNHLNWLKNKEKGGDKFFKDFFKGLDRYYREYLIKKKKADTISLIINMEN